jgi:hypothetical protein
MAEDKSKLGQEPTTIGDIMKELQELRKEHRQAKQSAWISPAAFGGSVFLLGISLYIQATAGTVSKISDAVFLGVVGMWFMVWSYRQASRVKV